MAKIDLSGIKGALKKLGGLRVFSVLLWPMVIVFAGVLVLTAAVIMGRSFRQRVEKQSIPMAQQITSVEDNIKPIKQVEVEREYQEAFERDANLVEKMMLQSSQRELLRYDIFPQPNDTSVLLFTRFGNKYRQQIEELISKVNGRDCPSEDELKESVQKSLGSSRIGWSRPGISAGNTQQDKIVNEICQSRAKSIGVYASARKIAGYDFWEQYQYTTIEEAVKDCWSWQLGYWIIEDVFSTIESLNAGSTNVFNSPVKRVIAVGFTAPGKLLSQRGGDMSSEKPKYVTKREEQLTDSLTERMSNEETDVVQFVLAVVLDKDEVMPFMKELCSAKEHRFSGYRGEGPVQVFKHNQICILESKIRPVVASSPEHKYYRYGGESAVEVELICEYVFNKKGYARINPESLKKSEEATVAEEEIY